MVGFAHDPAPLVSIPTAVCEEYKGDFCDHLPGYKQQRLIYVDRHESQWDEFGQLVAENWMLALYHRLISSGTELPDGCVEGLKELICHSTLPLCSSQGKGVTLHVPCTHILWQSQVYISVGGVIDIQTAITKDCQ